MIITSKEVKNKQGRGKETMAKLHFKYGAMNSGKSDSLIKTAFNYTERGLKVITIKPHVDTKGGDQVVARAGLSRKADIVADKNTNLVDKVLQHKKVDVVLIDEAQFLTTKQIDQLYEISKIHKISVIAHGLRTDFLSDLFPGSTRLFELADNIEKLPTMCRCGSQAEFNCRKSNGKYVFSGSQIAIDGEETITYDSLCGLCYLEEKAKT